jgi:heme/copper-type cytochrome/quinol oxidase subunit 1
MSWMRMPLFVWGIYATAVIQVLATPVIGLTAMLGGIERVFGFGFFDPAKGRGPGAVPAHVLVLLAPGRSTSWCCRRSR